MSKQSALNTTTFSTPFPVLDTDPHFRRVVSYFRPSDYLAWAAGTAGFPLGLYVLEKVNPTVRHARQLRAPLAVGALFGFIGGFFYAYQTSSQRFWGWLENEREQGKYRKEWKEALKQGKDIHGTSRLSPNLQQVAASNSRNAALKFDAIPWFNVVNHPYHGDQSAVRPEEAVQE